MKTELKSLLRDEIPERDQIMNLAAAVRAAQSRQHGDCRINETFRFTPYWHRLYQRKPAFEETIKSRVQGSILVDLAGTEISCGSFPRPKYSTFYEWANALGAQALITVNPFEFSFAFNHESVNPPCNPLRDLSETDYYREKETRLRRAGRPADVQHIRVRADALDFVSRLRDASVCFSVNGFDYFIAPNHEYHKELAKQMLRAVKPSGVIFGVGSNSLFYLPPEKTLSDGWSTSVFCA